MEQRGEAKKRSMALVQTLTSSLKLVLGRKDLRPYLWKPLFISAAAFIISVLATTAILTVAFSAWLGPWGYMAGVVAFVAAILFSGPIFLALSSIVSSFHWDPLGRKVEEICGLPSEFVGLTKGQFMVDTALRIAFAVFMLVFIVVLTFTPLIWVGWILSGILAFNDFTGVPYQRRGHIMPGTFFMAFKKKGALPLLGACIVLSALPFVMLLLHPVMACAGTLIVSEANIPAEQLPRGQKAQGNRKAD